MNLMQYQLCGRTIVGYDLRRPESLSAVHMTSYNEQTRYETIYDLYESQLSCLNLYIVDPLEIPSFLMPENGRVIAFDLPLPYVEAMAKGNVSVPPMLPWFTHLNSWDFLGFDVVDTRTQTSVLDLYLADSICTGAGNSIPTNKPHLIDSMAVAKKSQRIFDKKYPEHAPWIPCGVWLKRPVPGPRCQP